MFKTKIQYFLLLGTLLLIAACDNSANTEDSQSVDDTATSEDIAPIVDNPPADPQPENPPPDVENPPPDTENPPPDTENPPITDPQPVEDPAPVVTIDINDMTVPDDAAQPMFTIVLSSSSNETIRVSYETRDGSAIAGVDYQAEAGQLEFNPGDTVKHVDIELLKTEFEQTLAFDLVLADPENAELNDATGTATLLETEIITPLPDEPMLQESEFNPAWGEVGVFSDAGQCARCHSSDTASGVMTHNGKDVSPPESWRHSMMAQSVNDPYYQAVVADEAAHFPEMAGFIEDTCLHCHAPMAHTHAHQTQTSLDSDGYYRLETAMNDMSAREGISCTACHQIEDDGKLGTMESFNGDYSISSDRREIFGPYSNPISQPMLNFTGYNPVESAHITSSAYCATCHTLFTPTININDGQLTGTEFAEQTPYLEWLNSVYADGQAEARTCQQCHMPEPEAGYQTQIATKPNGAANPAWPERTPFSSHESVGGNTHTLTLLRDYRDILGIESSTSVDGFDEKIAETRALLAAAATLSIETPTLSSGKLNIPVTVNNLSGHKIPTSYPSRRMWLHLSVLDKSGRILFESGQADSKGRLALDDVHLQQACLDEQKDATAFDYSQCYEPHRDVITSAEQVAIYETVLGDVNGHVTYVLLYADEYLKDNRIPPKGFSRNQVPANGATAIMGTAASDADFNTETASSGSGQDTVHYQIDVADSSGPYRIEAELLYQSVRPGFAAALHAGDDPRIARYKQMYEAVPPTVEKLAEDSRDF